MKRMYCSHAAVLDNKIAIACCCATSGKTNCLRCLLQFETKTIVRMRLFEGELDKCPYPPPFLSMKHQHT